MMPEIHCCLLVRESVCVGPVCTGLTYTDMRSVCVLALSSSRCAVPHVLLAWAFTLQHHTYTHYAGGTCTHDAAVWIGGQRRGAHVRTGFLTGQPR